MELVFLMGDRSFDLFVYVLTPCDRDANWRSEMNFKLYTF
jgi:hypothetical protein